MSEYVQTFVEKTCEGYKKGKQLKTGRYDVSYSTRYMTP